MLTTNTEINYRIPCVNCDGTGKRWLTGAVVDVPCYKCDGTGYHEHWAPLSEVIAELLSMQRRVA